MQANAKPAKRGIRPESPDSPIITARQKIFSGKRGYVSTGLRRMSGRSGEARRENRPLSTLFSNPERPPVVSRDSFGNVAIFPIPSQPRLNPDQPISPVISARQEMLLEK